MARRLREVVLFGLAGVAGYAIDVLVTLILVPFAGVYIARLPAFLAAATLTWVINRKLAFRERTSRYDSLGKEYAHYLSLMIGGAMINYAVYAVAITLLEGSAYDVFIAVALGSLAGMIMNYLLSKRYIYNK